MRGYPGSLRVIFIGLALLASSREARADVVNVDNVDKLRAALSAAKAGDEIVLADGTYAVSGANMSCPGSGTTDKPIVVRAANPLQARLQLATVEGFLVTGPNWHFEGLDVKGVCANDPDCEHAFHVTGNATGFVLRKSRVMDFNAQIKVNANAGGAGIPHGGLVEGNELFDTHSRNTSNPVTKVNIDTGDSWIVRANYIHDWHRFDGSPVYAAFMKSGGNKGLFERNLVVCTTNGTAADVQIGLSFGGGGTGNEFCAPKFDPAVACSIEHTDGTMRNNIIANCGDVGIYLNRAKNTKLYFNTLINTSGIDYRFDTTSGDARGNVLTGKIRDRDGATHTDTNNLAEVDLATFTAMYMAPLAGDLRKKGDLGALLGKAPALGDVPDDYCARKRSGQYDLGALQASLGDCVTTTPVLGDGGTAPITDADGGVTIGTGGDGGSTSGGDPPPGASSSGATANADGGTTPNGASNTDDGCSCRTTRDPAGAVIPPAFAVFALFLLRRRRS